MKPGDPDCVISSGISECMRGLVSIAGLHDDQAFPPEGVTSGQSWAHSP